MGTSVAYMVCSTFFNREINMKQATLAALAAAGALALGSAAGYAATGQDNRTTSGAPQQGNATPQQGSSSSDAAQQGQTHTGKAPGTNATSGKVPVSEPGVTMGSGSRGPEGKGDEASSTTGNTPSGSAQVPRGPATADRNEGRDARGATTGDRSHGWMDKTSNGSSNAMGGSAGARPGSDSGSAVPSGGNTAAGSQSGDAAARAGIGADATDTSSNTTTNNTTGTRARQTEDSAAVHSTGEGRGAATMGSGNSTQPDAPTYQRKGQ